MNAKRLLLTLIAIAALVPLAGCRHRCCGDRSYAPPPCHGCGTVPPGYVPAPGP